MVIHLMKSLGFTLVVLSLSWVGGLASADEVTQGKALFMQYCASCHGPNGAGDGPLASSLKTPPANLRLLSLRFGNPLPQDVIARFIDGRDDVKAHGPRDMPVWGERFYAESNGEEAKVMGRIARLVAFLQSLQTGARTASVSLEWGGLKESGGPNQPVIPSLRQDCRGTAFSRPSGKSKVRSNCKPEIDPLCEPAREVPGNLAVSMR